jgi:hypothetical protein
MNRRVCARCNAPFALASRKSPAGSHLACVTCGQPYVAVESPFLFGVTSLVILLAATREWIPALATLPIVAAVAYLGTTHHPIDPTQAVPSRWTSRWRITRER